MFAFFNCYMVDVMYVYDPLDIWGSMFYGTLLLCIFQLAHGADPSMKNQEGQTPLDLSTAEDVRSLLIDAMPIGASTASPTPPTANTGVNTTPQPPRPPASGVASPKPDRNTTTGVSASAVASAAAAAVPVGAAAAGAVGGVGVGVGSATPSPPKSKGDGAMETTGAELSSSNPLDMSIGAFLKSIQLDHLRDIFEKEQVRK